MKLNTKNLMLVGAIAVAPATAIAFTGNLLHCDPTDGLSSVVAFSKGLACAETPNKLKLQIRDKDGNSIDGCNAVSGGAPWDLWAANKVGSKITQANAALIDHVELKMKGTVFSSCNLSGSATSSPATVTGQVAFKDALGNRIKGGKANFIAKVGADLPTQSAVLNGIINKGFGVGAEIRVQVGLDVGNPVNGNIVACNLGLVCPPDLPQPVEELALVTLPSSVLRIDVTSSAACVGVNDPFDCCTGAGTGSCDD